MREYGFIENPGFLMKTPVLGMLPSVPGAPGRAGRPGELSDP